MPPLKTSATVISKASFAKIPRIGSPSATHGKRQHVYCEWLGNLLKGQHNTNVFLRSKKQEVDECFRLQATQQFPRGSGDLEKALAEIDCIHSKAFWDSKMNAVQHFANHFPDKGHEESLEHLTLPRIEMTRGENRDVWKTQTYADFAQKLKRKNPDTLLTKDIADAAFRMAAMRMVDPRKGRDSAIVRCLGKESTKYWKG